MIRTDTNWRTQSEIKALREEPIIYVEPRVEMVYPTKNDTYTDTESVFRKLPKGAQRLLNEAFRGVPNGISKKGIFFGAAAMYSLVSGEINFDHGSNTDTDAGDTFCAERNLLGRLSGIPGFKSLEALAIVANMHESKEQGHQGPRAPCHACRQQISNVIHNPALPVYMASSKWNEIIVTRMGNLLPLAYLEGNKFEPSTILKFRIPTLKIFTTDDLNYRSRHGDDMATNILEVAALAKEEYPKGIKHKKKWNLWGNATGVAALVSKPVKTGMHTNYEDLLISSFSPNFSGKSAIRCLMADLQRTCGIKGKVNVVGIHGHPSDFPGALAVPSAGGRQAVYDRVFFQNSNALFVLTMENSHHVVTVDARYLLPLGKPVMESIDLAKHEEFAQSIISAGQLAKK